MLVSNYLIAIKDFYHRIENKRQCFAKSSTHNCMICIMAALLLIAPSGDEAFDIRDRRAMISQVQKDTVFMGFFTGLFQIDEKVLSSMLKVSRRNYVPLSYTHKAYHNVALPLYDDYYLPEPYMVALMLHMLDISPTDKVLEIGVDSGYHATIMAYMADKVYSLPHVDLTDEAQINVPRSNRDIKDKIVVKSGDGFYGWKEKGPYNAILVKQAFEYVPHHLIEQLAVGGRMVVPVGSQNGTQKLMLFVKQDNGEIISRRLVDIQIAPLSEGKWI